MRRLRQLSAVVMVATALCVGRLTAPVADARPQVAEFARQIAGRITMSLRRVVPAARLGLADHRSIAQEPPVPAVHPAQTPVHREELSPFQFRLPPPMA